MERRTFVLSAGAIVGGGGLALGTGAFDSVEGERDVGITVADDADGYLSIRPHDGPNGAYATMDGGELAVELTDDNGAVAGAGVNANALTGVANLFTIQNQGTNEVELAVSPLTFLDVSGSIFPPSIDGVLGVLLIPQSGNWSVDPERGVLSITDLAPGEETDFSLAAVAFPESAIDEVEIDDELLITAEA